MKYRVVRFDFLGATKIVFWDCTPKQAAAVLRRKFRRTIKASLIEEIERDHGGLGSHYYVRKSSHGVIWLSEPPRKRPDLLAHEALHAVMHILDYRGMDALANNGELPAHMLDYIMAKVLGLELL